jgi:hypothetical protein
MIQTVKKRGFLGGTLAADAAAQRRNAQDRE